jgi:hypothetical protein
MERAGLTGAHDLGAEPLLRRPFFEHGWDSWHAGGVSRGCLIGKRVRPGNSGKDLLQSYKHEREPGSCAGFWRFWLYGHEVCSVCSRDVREDVGGNAEDRGSGRPSS